MLWRRQLFEKILTTHYQPTPAETDSCFSLYSQLEAEFTMPSMSTCESLYALIYYKRWLNNTIIHAKEKPKMEKTAWMQLSSIALSLKVNHCKLTLNHLANNLFVLKMLADCETTLLKSMEYNAYISDAEIHDFLVLYFTKEQLALFAHELNCDRDEHVFSPLAPELLAMINTVLLEHELHALPDQPFTSKQSKQGLLEVFSDPNQPLLVKQTLYSRIYHAIDATNKTIVNKKYLALLIELLTVLQTNDRNTLMRSHSVIKLMIETKLYQATLAGYYIQSLPPDTWDGYVNTIRPDNISLDFKLKLLDQLLTYKSLSLLDISDNAFVYFEMYTQNRYIIEYLPEKYVLDFARLMVNKHLELDLVSLLALCQRLPLSHLPSLIAVIGETTVRSLIRPTHGKFYQEIAVEPMNTLRWQHLLLFSLLHKDRLTSSIEKHFFHYLSLYFPQDTLKFIQLVKTLGLDLTPAQANGLLLYSLPDHLNEVKRELGDAFHDSALTLAELNTIFHHASSAQLQTFINEHYDSICRLIKNKADLFAILAKQPHLSTIMQALKIRFISQFITDIDDLIELSQYFQRVNEFSVFLSLFDAKQFNKIFSSAMKIQIKSYLLTHSADDLNLRLDILQHRCPSAHLRIDDALLEDIINRDFTILIGLNTHFTSERIKSIKFTNPTAIIEKLINNLNEDDLFDQIKLICIYLPQLIGQLSETELKTITSLLAAADTLSFIKLLPPKLRLNTAINATQFLENIPLATLFEILALLTIEELSNPTSLHHLMDKMTRPGHFNQLIDFFSLKYAKTIINALPSTYLLSLLFKSGTTLVDAQAIANRFKDATETYFCYCLVIDKIQADKLFMPNAIGTAATFFNASIKTDPTHTKVRLNMNSL